jgi:hypothetical protein
MSLEAYPQEKISESGNGYESTSVCGDCRVGYEYMQLSPHVDELYVTTENVSHAIY